MSWTATVRANLIPPPGLPRRLSVQNILFGIGTGTFLTGSAVYFTKVVGLQPYEVGIGLSIAAGCSLLTAVPLSSFADRFGPRRTWVAGVLAEAALFAAWPFARGFWEFLALVVALQLANTVGQAGRSVYLVEALDPETRVITQAFGRSALNIGWSAGATLAGAALAVGTRPAFYALVLTNSALLFANAYFLHRLPEVARTAPRPAAGSRRVVFSDRPFLAVTAVCSVLLIYGTVEMEVAPLWIITHTDAPTWTLAVLTCVNTLMATTIQVALTRGVHTVAGAVRVLRLAGAAAALGCPLYLLSGATSGWATIGLLFVATVTLTMAEMWQSAGAWTLPVELSPVDRRGEYFGAFRMGASLQAMTGPAALIALAVTTGGWGWLVISAIFVGAALFVGPVAAWAATRHAARTAGGPAALAPAT